MKSRQLHRWNVTPAEAREIQSQLAPMVERRDRLPKLRLVAGADVSLEIAEPGGWRTGRGRAFAGVVVYRFPQMEEVERASAHRPLRFPYVPGLLSFREIPALLAAFAKLRHAPDLVFCDGQGYAHPRRMGIASHLGLLLDRPTIGVAKSVLVGSYREPPVAPGKSSPLVDDKTGEIIGAALRTRKGAHPVFVSLGHRISLRRAIQLTLAVSDGPRIPRPTRDADRYLAMVRRAHPAPKQRLQVTVKIARKSKSNPHHGKPPGRHTRE